MIAAYSASVHEPSIYLKENADTDSNDITTLYATIDDAIEEEAANKADARLDGADSTQDVYFTVKDSNLVRNQIDELLFIWTFISRIRKKIQKMKRLAPEMIRFT